MKDVNVLQYGKKMIVFVDNLNVPAKDIQVAAATRTAVQWIDYGFWYDWEKRTVDYIKYAGKLLQQIYLAFFFLF